MDATHGIKTAIGVDLEGQHLTIASCTRSRTETKCEVLYDGPAPQDGNPTLPKQLAEAADRMDTSVTACLPVSRSFARWLHSPLRSANKARKVLPSLLDIQLPFPIESCAYTFVDLQRNKEDTVDALAVAARKEDIERRRSGFQAAGLNPESIDHEGLAVWALTLSELPLEKDVTRVTCYLGRTHCTLVIGRGVPEKGNDNTTRGFLSAHSIRVGTEDFEQGQAGKDRAVSQFASRAQQVLRSQALDLQLQWVWTGPGADNDACVDSLQRSLQAVQDARFLKHKDATSFLARAIACRSLNPGTTYCNLLQDELAPPKALQRTSRSQIRAAAAILVAALFLIALAVTWEYLLQARASAGSTTLGKVTEELTGLPANATKGQEALLVTRALDEEAATIAPFKAVFAERLTKLVGTILETARTNDIVIESVSVREDSVSVRGAAGDWDRCGIIADLLKKRGFDAEIERHDAGADERVHFAIRATRPRNGEDPS